MPYGQEVTDPGILSQFSDTGETRTPVTDPGILKAFDAAPAEMGRAPGDASAAIGGGILEGIPVVGPAVKQGGLRLAAGVRSLQNGTPYADELQNVTNWDKGTQEAHPVATTAGNIGGAAVGTFPLMATAPAAFGIGEGSLLARSGMSALSGAAIGGADSAVRSGGDADATVTGALSGLGLGAAGPTAGAILGPAIGKAISAIDAKIPFTAGRLTPAVQKFGEALGSDAIAPEEAASRLSALGPAAMPADLGPNLQRQAGALAGSPGPAQQVVRSAMADRQMGAGSRIIDAANGALGGPVDLVSTAQDIINQRAAAAKPLYDAAYGKAMPKSPAVEAVLTTPAGKSAWEKAQALALNEGIPLDPASRSVRALDLTKRAMDDQISAAQRQGNNNEARILTSLRGRLVNAVDSAVPEYAQARAAFSGPTNILEAMDSGTSIFSNAVTPGQLKVQLAQMGADERQAYQQGARSALSDIMGTARNDAATARGVFAKGYNREKLQMLIGDDPASSLLSALDNEAQFARTNQVATQNSETFARQQAAKQINPDLNDTPGIIRSALNLKPGDALAKVAGKVTGALGARAQLASNEELAQILADASSDKSKLMPALGRLMQAKRAGQINENQARVLSQALLRSGGMEESRKVSGGP